MCRIKVGTHIPLVKQERDKRKLLYFLKLFFGRKKEFEKLQIP